MFLFSFSFGNDWLSSAFVEISFFFQLTLAFQPETQKRCSAGTPSSELLIGEFLEKGSFKGVFLSFLFLFLV